jgi:hypothetical protein
MSTIAMMRTGHHRLADGSLLRVDIEQDRWVGSLCEGYRPTAK